MSSQVYELVSVFETPQVLKSVVVVLCYPCTVVIGIVARITSQ